MEEWPKTIDDGASLAMRLAISGLEKCNKVTPQILAETRGSFTSSNKQESIYTIVVGGCGIGINQFGSRRLILARDGIPTASFETGGEILKAFDLNRDGRDEALLSWGECRNDICKRSANIIKVEESKIITILELGTIYESDCKLEQDGLIRIKDISARNSNGHTLIEQVNMERPCPMK
jgi:hypothetical protein